VMRFCLLFAPFFLNAAVYSGVEIKDVNIKNQGQRAKVSPGETFGIHAVYEFHDLKEKGARVQLIFGYEDKGGQVCVANGLIGWDHKCYDHYSLYCWQKKVDITKKEVNIGMVAPEIPGIYEIHFQKLFADLPEDAISNWIGGDGACIGRIVVQ